MTIAHYVGAGAYLLVLCLALKTFSDSQEEMHQGPAELSPPQGGTNGKALQER